MPVSDDFESLTPSASLGGQGSWALVEGNIRVIDSSGDNVVKPETVSQTVAARYSGAKPEADHWSEITIDAVVSGSFIGPAVRASDSDATYYSFLADSGNLYIERIVSGSDTTLDSNAVTVSPGDVLRLKVEGVGATVTLTMTINGSPALIGTNGVYEDTDAARIVDAGWAGICGFNVGASYGDDWKAGDVHHLVADDITTTPVVGTPALAEPVTDNVVIATTRVACNTSLGDQIITTTKLGGLTPKLAILTCVRATVNDTPADHLSVSHGMTDGTNHFVTHALNEHGQAGSSPRRIGTTDQIVMINSPSTPTAREGEATFSEFVTNGLTINWNDALDGAYLLTVTFFAGSDLSADVGTISLLSSPTSLTGLSYEPDVVLMSGHGSGWSDTTSPNGEWFQGWAVNDGSETQMNHAFDNISSASAGDPAGILQDDHIISNFYNNGINRDFFLTSFNSDGFTTEMDWAGSDLSIGYATLNFGGAINVWAGVVDSKIVSTGELAYTGIGFKPQAALMLPTTIKAVNTAVTDGDAGVTGFSAMDATDQYCSTVQEEYGSAETDNQSLSSDSALLVPLDDGSDGYQASFVSFDSDGFTLNYSIVDAEARKICVLAFEEVLGSGEDNLTAVDITTTPVLDTPALGQEHDLTAVDISTTPVLDTPALGQEHDLTAVDISTTPVLDTPEVTEIYNLTATGITTTPVLDTPFITTEGEDNLTAVDITDNLTAVDITTTPVLDTPALGQEHDLIAVDISTTPVLDTPEIGQEHALTAVDISTTPVLDTPEIGQEGDLFAIDISTTPVLDTPALGQEHVLVATEITANPVLDTPALGQEHALTVVDISTTPVLDTPALAVGAYNLTAVDISTTPVLDTPALGQEHDLTATEITANPVLDTPAIGQEGDLFAIDISTTPVLDTPALGQEHVLAATEITANPVLDTPAIGQEGDLFAIDISTTPVLDTPAIGQEHVLTAVDISSAPVLDTPALVQEHALTVVDIATTPVLDTPELSEIYNLTATGITTTPALDTPVLEQEHVLSASGITANPIFDTPFLITEGEDNLLAQGHNHTGFRYT